MAETPSDLHRRCIATKGLRDKLPDADSYMRQVWNDVLAGHPLVTGPYAVDEDGRYVLRLTNGATLLYDPNIGTLGEWDAYQTQQSPIRP
jgi:hypothetical protein